MCPAASHRLQWLEIPSRVREWIEATLGAPVVRADGQAGGYGPGLAARCELKDGRRVFIKAVSAAQNPDTPAMMRGEAAIVRGLPASVPAARLLEVLDDGTWIVLVFEEVPGRQPTTPWVPAELERVARATVALARHEPPAGLPSVADAFGPMFTGWRTLAIEDRTSVFDPWCRRHIDRLAALEVGWEDAARGDHLVHGDVRSDNMLLVGDHDVVFVDWTSTCVGAYWFDLLGMLPSIELEGGGQPEEVLALAGLAALDHAVLAPVVCAFAGYFAERSRLPDPPGLPTVRAFQRAQGEATIAWLRRMVDWE
jgi:aminoglycoside phosphotransferase